MKASVLIDALADIARPVQFEDGEALRIRGVFASDILLITKGNVDCILSESDDIRLKVSSGDIVGEIGFLTGRSANATLRAVGEVSALSLDGATLGQLQRDKPGLAAQVLRHLATLMRDRTEENEDLLTDMDATDSSPLEIVRCSTLDQLRIAQMVRYDVFCVELGRTSQFADDAEGTIVDDLDKSGTSFLAYHEGQPVGTARVNLGRDSDFGPLPEIYGMSGTGFALPDTSIVTKYAIREAHRGGSAYIKLFAAIAGFVQSAGVTSLFIDCVPNLARFYATMGFERTAPDFVHYENGLSVPMVLGLEKYAGRMSLEDRIRRNHWR